MPRPRRPSRASPPRTAAPVLVVGHSMGGGLAGALAARRPDLVSAVVLEDPAWRDPAERVQPRGIVHERVAECRAFAEDPAGQLDKGRADNPTWPEVELAPWVESKAQVDLDFLDLGIANLLEPWDEIVAAITVPALVLLAERGGPVTPAVRGARRRAGQPARRHPRGRRRRPLHPPRPHRGLPCAGRPLARRPDRLGQSLTSVLEVSLRSCRSLAAASWAALDGHVVDRAGACRSTHRSRDRG